MVTNYRSNIENKTYNFYIHRLVAKYFIGDIPSGYVVNHKDGNKLNNHYSNLEIVTYSENIRHADKIGLRKCASGIKNGNGKVSDAKIFLIIYYILNTDYTDTTISNIMNKNFKDNYVYTAGYINSIRMKKKRLPAWKRYLECATTIEKIIVSKLL